MAIPSIRFDNQINFKIPAENTAPQITQGAPSSKSLPNVGLAYSPTPTRTVTLTPTPTVSSVISNTLFGWGSVYVLGLGVLIDTQLSPIQLNNDNWLKVDLGSSFVLAIKNNRSLWGWGVNQYGQLGVPSPEGVYNPIQIGDDTWQDIATLINTSYGIRSDGLLFSWGKNTTQGLLGIGSSEDTFVSTPTQIGTSLWRKLVSSALYDYMFAIQNNGTLWGWGYNANNRLGDGTTETRYEPTVIASSITWYDVSCGGSHSAAIASNGNLYAWGYNPGGLGNGITSASSPQRIGSSVWRMVSCGVDFTVGITSNGRLYAWGKNDKGQLGVGDTTDRSTFTLVNSSTWKHVSAGNNYVLAVRSDNTLWAWGTGNLGTGEADITLLTPTQIGTNEWLDISAGIAAAIGRQEYVAPLPTPTSTPTRTVTPTITPSTTRTSTPTPTPTITNTQTPSITPTQTVTITSSVTPTASRECLIGETFLSIPLDAQTSWSDIAYGNNTYAIIESLNANLYGDNLNNVFLGQGMPTAGTNFWKSIVYAQNKFVAVGASPVSAYSLDGIVWSSGSSMPIASVTNYTWNKIIYDEDSTRFIAAASSSSSNVQSRLAISTDGISWSEKLLPTLTSTTNNATINSKNYLSIVAIGDRIIVGSDAVNEHISGSTNYSASLLTSTNDGAVWVDRSLPELTTVDANNYNGNIVKLIYGNNKFLALAKGKQNGSNCYRIYYSNTAVDWYIATTVISEEADLMYGGVTAYGSGKFLLIAKTSGINYSTYHSEFGISWYSTGSTFEIPNGIRSTLAAQDNNLIILSTDRALINTSCLDGSGY